MAASTTSSTDRADRYAHVCSIDHIVSWPTCENLSSRQLQPTNTYEYVFPRQQLFAKVFCCLCSFLCCSAFELCHQSQRIKSEQIKTFDIFLQFDFCFFVICNYICFCLISFIVVRMTLWPLSRIVMISPANGYCSELKCDLFNSSCYFTVEFIETENVCKN